jgi:carbon storage regulator CsrA
MIEFIRKTGEAIQIGNNISIIIKSMDEAKVKLVIDAPRDIRIERMDKGHYSYEKSHH